MTAVAVHGRGAAGGSRGSRVPPESAHLSARSTKPQGYSLTTRAMSLAAALEEWEDKGAPPHPHDRLRRSHGTVEWLCIWRSFRLLQWVGHGVLVGFVPFMAALFWLAWVRSTQVAPELAGSPILIAPPGALYAGRAESSVRATFALFGPIVVAWLGLLLWRVPKWQVALAEKRGAVEPNGRAELEDTFRKIFAQVIVGFGAAGALYFTYQSNESSEGLKVLVASVLRAPATMKSDLPLFGRSIVRPRRDE